jgi:hypothetical protein
MNKFNRRVAALIFTMAVFSNAYAVPTFGVKVTGSDLDPDSGFLSDGGAGSSSASVSFSTFRAEASFNPLSTYLPILKARSTGLDSLFDDDRTQANAMAYQAFTSSINQTISLNIRLDSDVSNLSASGTLPGDLPAGTSSVLANVFVFSGPGFSVDDVYCSAGEFTFDGIYLCGEQNGQSTHIPGLKYSNLFNNGANPVELDLFTFDVMAGESFGIFSELSAGSFRGDADAFNTLTMVFEDDDFISAINVPSSSPIPLPGGVWLFAAGMMGLFWQRRRLPVTELPRQ